MRWKSHTPLTLLSSPPPVKTKPKPKHTHKSTNAGGRHPAGRARRRGVAGGGEPARITARGREQGPHRLLRAIRQVRVDVCGCVWICVCNIYIYITTTTTSSRHTHAQFDDWLAPSLAICFFCLTRHSNHTPTQHTHTPKHQHQQHLQL